MNISGCCYMPFIEDKVIIHKSWVEAPRWADFSNFLRKLCMNYDVKLNIEESKGFLFVTTYYTITGKESYVNSIKRDVRNALQDYMNK